MAHPWSLAALAIALLMAGCTAAPAPPDSPLPNDTVTGPPTGNPTDTTTRGDPTSTNPGPKTMTIRGVVLGAGLEPLAGANVTILETKTTQSTGADGAFRFEGLVLRTYFLTATAPEHVSKTLSVDPATGTGSGPEPVRFQLEHLPTARPFNVTIPFQGHIQCALEVLIISPSCDSLLVYAGQDPVFEQQATATLPVDPNWKTIVGDVRFDPEAHPLLDGIRISFRGTYNQSDTGTYEQYGRFFGSEPFSFRIEPGTEYEEGVAPVPANATLFQFDGYPHSHAWHALCVPPESGTCFLGAGAGIDVSFDLYLTVFYVEAAPEGWTFAPAEA